jgi:hypothetical protein
MFRTIKKNKYGLMLIVLLLIIIICDYHHYNNRIEGFDNFIDGYIDPFDDTYVKMYSKVFHYPTLIRHYLNEIETKTIRGKLKPDEVSILEAGTGTGEMYKAIPAKYNKVGVERSAAFAKYAKINNPTGDIITDDLKNTNIFPNNKFTHVFCFMDTLYHNNFETEVPLILDNFNTWLKPKGYLCIHIFDQTDLDPAPREYSQYVYKDKIKHAVTYFKHFSHEGWWDIDNNRATYTEKFIIDSGHKKTNKLTLNIPPVKEIINIIQTHHFKLVNIISERNEVADLYIFKKV